MFEKSKHTSFFNQPPHTQREHGEKNMFLWNQYAITASETEKGKQNEQYAFISKRKNLLIRGGQSNKINSVNQETKWI